MNNATEHLKNYSNLLSEQLMTAGTDYLSGIFSLDIDCEELAAFEHGCHGNLQTSNIFAQLHHHPKNINPGIYWFEIISPHDAHTIRTAYTPIRQSLHFRKLPAIEKKYETNSKILYVGKGKSNLSGRMFLHLGYEPKQLQLQGLQLCHWDYTGILKGLKLKLNIIYLPQELADFAPLFEHKLAKTLRPILGKHRN